MAILISDTSATSTTLNTTLVGDGVSSSVSLDLQEAPVSLVFNGNTPAQVLPFPGGTQIIALDGTVDNSFTYTSDINKTKITLTFNKPLPAATFPFPPNAAGRVTLSVKFLYSGA